jgi:exodeoxyribonuclease VII large subunit
MATYLTVPFAQKDKVKALGARWDAAERQWFVPPGLDLAQFSTWLPAQAAGSPAPGASQDLIAVGAGAVAPAATDGVSLAHLLDGVERAVAQAYREGVWTRVDVVSVSAKNGHVYLEVSERNEEGVTIAQARAAIWARTAARILPEFQRASGAELAPGIKLLVRAKPVYKAQYGFSLEVTEIDASYTVGDLEAQKRRIRERLQAEGMFDRNKRLVAPWDFTRLLVVSPHGAAGLGDFAAEADRLHALRVCEFIYVHSRFQGAGAPAEILSAAQAGLGQATGAPLDALIIIRGGGAVNDLAWLNDYDLARFVCTCSVPVLTGIGHERDSTLLDEVAHRSFDTPSKVIGAIERQIALRARDAKSAYNDILVQAGRFSERASIGAERLDSEIRATARSTLATARSETDSAINQVHLASHSHVHEARHEVQLARRQVQDGARQHVAQAKTHVPSAMASVNELSRAALRQVRGNVQTLLPAVLEQAGTNVQLARRNLRTSREALSERAQQSVRAARAGADGLVREVTGQGPKKTLARGFAVVRGKDGKTVTSAQAARQAGNMELTFNDGAVKATVQAKKNEGAKDGH